MNPEKIEEFERIYAENKKIREPMPTGKDVLLEIMQVYRLSKTKRDKKKSAKLILKAKQKMLEYDFWKFIDEDELKRVCS